MVENHLDRQFAVGHSLPAWVGDLTYLPTREGRLYLAAVIDLRTRQVLGYSLSERMSDDRVRQAFLNAWSASPVPPGVVNPPQPSPVFSGNCRCCHRLLNASGGR